MRYLNVTFNLTQAEEYMREHTKEMHHMDELDFKEIPFMFTFSPYIRTATICCETCCKKAVNDFNRQIKLNHSLYDFIDKYNAEAEIDFNKSETESES